MMHSTRKCLLTALVAMLIVSSCEEVIKKEKPLDKFSWIEGEWIGVTEEVVMQESWEKVNDDLYKAHAYVLAETDTIFQEYIKLQVVNDTVYYVVFIPGIPDSTSFRLTMYEKGEAVFENPEHDYPQKIVYKQVGTDSLYAYIEGEAAGEVQREEFPYKRQSAPPKEKRSE